MTNYIKETKCDEIIYKTIFYQIALKHFTKQEESLLIILIFDNNFLF